MAFNHKPGRKSSGDNRMIAKREIREKAREYGVPESTIERDYTQNWLLKYLTEMEMALKGGTGIRKTYIGDYRFSDDLDFTMLSGVTSEKLKNTIKRAVEKAI
jgi:predicted nucleotidyltransferase component of viral defense system